MINDEQLNTMNQVLELHPNGTHAIIVDTELATLKSWMLTGETLRELIGLAKLGLWAKEHAIPALQWEDNRCGKVYGPLGDALAALPKEVTND